MSAARVDKQEEKEDMDMHAYEPQRPDLSLATIEDCLDMYEKKNMAVVCNDGQVLYFVEEKKQ